MEFMYNNPMAEQIVLQHGSEFMCQLILDEKEDGREVTDWAHCGRTLYITFSKYASVRIVQFKWCTANGWIIWNDTKR